MGGDVVAIDKVLGDEDVEHGVEEGDVGAWPQGQVQVGQGRRFGAAGVGDDDLEVGVGRLGVFDPAIDDGMGDGWVGAGDEDHLRQADVLVAARRRVGAQGLLVAGDGGRHAEAGIGIDVVGADEPLGQLVEDVIVLGEQLPGDIEGDGIRAMAADDLGKAPGGMVQGFIPGGAPALGTAPAAQFRVEQAVFGPGRQMERCALGAQPAPVGRVVGIAADADDAVVLALDDDAATDAAIATGGSGFQFHDFFSGHPSATDMPQRKNNDLEMKLGGSVTDPPNSGAS